MAFEAYDRKPEGTAQKIDPKTIILSVSQGQRKGHKVHALVISIGSDVLAEAQLKVGDRVYRYFGSEEDKGKLLLIKVPEEDLKQRKDAGILIGSCAKNIKKSGSAEGRLPGHGLINAKVAAEKPIEDFAEREIKKTVVEGSVDAASGGLVIKLPDAFFLTSSRPLSDTSRPSLNPPGLGPQGSHLAGRSA